ncbi:MAG: ATP-binding protein [Cytophagia bacterium]|nr:MAG: ATP-binding protein [Runella sp.]TAG21138.1 MAG: ATP-binding protein [Cytophagales bacterium]TAG40276.1 MAG: ATP-binding protein [Cytophagia bacterium]TAG58197.1 MAG: ATP-binding protein [Runella slithyformis]TAG82694.1 MAG: ATP-binding protein [Cytophagales bacterium]
MIARNITPKILEDLSFFPAVAIVGARQVGKTTLARSLQKKIQKESIYLDLESEEDAYRLENAESYLLQHLDKCVVIDEIQRMPRLFPLLRSLIDRKREPARFLLLGSASPELVKGSSESLAGRIAYTELCPVHLLEIQEQVSMQMHWLRGGFPVPLLAPNQTLSTRWQSNFIQTFVERDLRFLGQNISEQTLTKLLRMLVSAHSNLLNISDLSRSLDISQPAVSRYLDILEGSFVIQRLMPYFQNIGKRLVKTPKLYIRDSGLFHNLARIYDFDNLSGHLLVGASWEGYVVEQIREIAYPDSEMYFYRTQNGAEADLVLIRPDGTKWCIEIKYSNSPVLSKGFFQSCEDLKPEKRFVIVPTTESFVRNDGIQVCNLAFFLNQVLSV